MGVFPKAGGGASLRPDERVAEMLGAVVAALVGDHGDFGPTATLADQRDGRAHDKILL